MLLSCVMLAVSLAAEAPIFEGEYVCAPDPKHDHSSSIVETPKGDLLTVWFHGSGERTCDDVLLLGARKRAGESTWCEPYLMADTPDLPDCNPVLFMDPRGTLWLIWITVQDNQWGGALLKYRTSTDYDGDGPPKWAWQDVIHARPTNLEQPFLAMIENGEKTLAPMLKMMPKMREEVEMGKKAATTKLDQRLGWMTRTHPIMVSETRMMVGLYSDVFNCSLAAFTEDWGKTWTFSEPILDPEAKYLSNIQPSFVRKKDGTIMAFMRDNGIPKKVRTATSADNGQTWSRLGMLDIRNPGSSVECIALADGAWVLVCNDRADGRHVLAAYLSDDEGATWPARRVLEEREDKEKGSFSYPSVMQSRDGALHCTYSFSAADVPEGSCIKHVRFNEAWLRATP